MTSFDNFSSHFHIIVYSVVLIGHHLFTVLKVTCFLVFVCRVLSLRYVELTDIKLVPEGDMPLVVSELVAPGIKKLLLIDIKIAAVGTLTDGNNSSRIPIRGTDITHIKSDDPNYGYTASKYSLWDRVHQLRHTLILSHGN